MVLHISDKIKKKKRKKLKSGPNMFILSCSDILLILSFSVLREEMAG